MQCCTLLGGSRACPQGWIRLALHPALTVCITLSQYPEKRPRIWFRSKVALHCVDETTGEVLPEEVENPESYVEGATKTISVNIYERNPQARKACLLAYGHRCSVCDFSFEALYGEIGRGFIHVHHLKQLADIGSEYQLNPLTDLRPVCPNCHAMLHRRRPAYSIEELVELRNTAKKLINRTH